MAAVLGPLGRRCDPPGPQSVGEIDRDADGGLGSVLCHGYAIARLGQDSHTIPSAREQ